MYTIDGYIRADTRRNGKFYHARLVDPSAGRQVILRRRFRTASQAIAYANRLLSRINRP